MIEETPIKNRSNDLDHHKSCERVEDEVIFGQSLKLKHFSHFDERVLRLNNGSFGASPLSVLNHQREVYFEWLKNPDDFWHQLPNKFLTVRESVVRDLLGSSVAVEDVVIIDNLTTGIASVVQSIIANLSTDTNANIVLMSNFTYNAVRLAVEYGCETANKRGSSITIERVNIPFPILETESAKEVILESYESVLRNLQEQGKAVAFAFLDHIVSLPSMLIPIAELVPLCRKYNVKEVLCAYIFLEDEIYLPKTIASNTIKDSSGRRPRAWPALSDWSE
jgi:hypothetical protein